MARSTLVSLLLLLAQVGAVRPARAQSLADLAKQEEERRKTAKETGRVYTNKDLRDVPPTTGTPSTTAAGDAAKPETADASADKDEKDDAPSKTAGTEKTRVVKDQKYWGERIKALRTSLERDQTLADALQTHINSLTADFTNRDDPAQRSVIAQNRQKSLDELASLKQAIENDKKAIGDLEEEARRAGVPPGWLR
jgi:hypothetical protein